MVSDVQGQEIAGGAVRKALKRFRRGLFGLQFRTTLLGAFVVLAATGLTGVMYLHITAQLTMDESKRQARDLAKTLAAVSGNLIEADDRDGLLSLAEASMREGSLSYVLFADMAGNLLVSYQRGVGNMTHLMLNDKGQVSVEPINHPEVSLPDNASPQIDVVYPVVTAATFDADAAPESTVGYVRVGLSLAKTEERLAGLVRAVIGLAIGVALLMLPLGYEVVRNVVGPINRLSEAARSLASGKMDERVPIGRRDEVGRLAVAFNSMADDLAKSHDKLVRFNAELEDRVLQRTQELEEANEKLREMAARDALTGLYNRRQFSDLLGRLFAESTRYRSDLTCLMLDLDNFKRVNDSLGHHVGDQLLQLTATVIRETVRESDIPVRYGGDEFVVLLPRTSPGDARILAERIITEFRSRLMKTLPEASITSLSIGLASREQNEPAVATNLVNLADEALYLAKAGGKNRVTVVRPVAASQDLG